VRETEEHKQLVGYVIAAEGAPVTSSELRQYLKERLPDYMVPQAFVTLEQWPLTVNGKLDRRALPALERVGSEQDADESRTPIEELVAGIWAHVLRVGTVGIHANFFELGGHSLLATQLISRLRAAFSLELPLRLLFDVPTVAGQARAIEEALKGEAGVTAPPVLRVADRTRLPLSFAQKRLWFQDQFEPGSTAYNMPTALRLTGELSVKALEQS